MIEIRYTISTMTQKQPKPVVLIILDGVGIAPPSDGNAITCAKMPVLQKLIAAYPTMPVRASGEEVGLSWGEMGNSEVGHLTIGAGRVFYQTLPRINKSIADKSFFDNPAFASAVKHAHDKKGTLHLVGLVSPGRVHSMDTHLHALLEFCKKQKVKQVAVHAILDGRDTVYNSGIDFVTKLMEVMKKLKVGVLASLSGRYYAMDRDNRWDRVALAYQAMTGVGSVRAEDSLEAIRASYAKEVFDEEFVPTVLTHKSEPIAPMKDGDAVIFFNFRPDRARELTTAFVLPSFKKFPRTQLHNLFFVTMTEYEKGLPVTVAFAPDAITMPLARVLADAGSKQLHIAETEKYAHVTFFLNGTREEPFRGEDRVIIPSPHVAAYDTVPEMSAYEITKRVVKEVDAGKYDAIMVNFANGDMVGHTGNLKATVKAVEVVDECIGKIVDATLAKEGVVLITADHGNAEEVRNVQTGDIDKEHSTNPVPFIVVGSVFRGQASSAGEAPGGDLSLVPAVGMLSDVAPTMLKIMGIKQPPEMTGQSLV